MLRSRWSTALAVIALSNISHGQDRSALIKRTVEDFMAKNHVVGVSVAILPANGRAFQSGYGWQDRENKIPATESTIYRLGSISKTVTAVSTMQLVEAGKLSLATDVRKYAPEWPDKGVTITLQNLLTHTSGIRHYAPGKKDIHFKHYAPAEALDTFKDDPLLFPPGTKFSYSTHAFTLVARTVQFASGQDFGAYVKDHVSKPSNAPSLQLEDRSDGSKFRTQLYDPELVPPDKVEDLSWKCGGGGMEANAPDLARYGMALLSDRLLRPTTKNLMFTDQHVPGTKIGLCWFLSANGNPNHSGAQQGCKTDMLLDLKSKTAFVVLTNTGGNNPVSQLLNSVVKVWNGN